MQKHNCVHYCFWGDTLVVADISFIDDVMISLSGIADPET
jgi:hypothetical protein